MQKEIELNGKTFSYELIYKRVKNINLRITSDGSIKVSASRGIAVSEIEAFMKSKAYFITRAVEKFKNAPSPEKIQYFSEAEVKAFISDACRRVYHYYRDKAGIEYPQIKFRKMVSRWGSCHPHKGILTFNTNLMYAPAECVEYVVFHEFTHFLQANHSAAFYKELEQVCPGWKVYKAMLRKVNIR